MNVEKFGFDVIWEFTAMKLFKEKKNIFVAFYYISADTTLIETPMYILDKSNLDYKYPASQLKVEDRYVDRLSKDDGKHYLVNTTQTKFLRDRAFRNALNEIQMKHIFPNAILQTFFYTDNRTVIPKEFQVEEPIEEPKFKQLKMFY